MTTGVRPCRPGFQLWHSVHGRIDNPITVTDKKIGALFLAVGMVGAQSWNGLHYCFTYLLRGLYGPFDYTQTSFCARILEGKLSLRIDI